MPILAHAPPLVDKSVDVGLKHEGKLIVRLKVLWQLNPDLSSSKFLQESCNSQCAFIPGGLGAFFDSLAERSCLFGITWLLLFSVCQAEDILGVINQEVGWSFRPRPVRLIWD